jgi:hypothetical protein
MRAKFPYLARDAALFTPNNRVNRLVERRVAL